MPRCSFPGAIEVARFAELRFGHMPAGRRLEDLNIIKSGTCLADATQSCRNGACLCAPISLCVHGFFFKRENTFSVAIVYAAVLMKQPVWRLSHC